MTKEVSTKEARTKDDEIMTFARKCPKCPARWTDKKQWLDNNVQIGNDTVIVKGTDYVYDQSEKKLRKVVVEYVIGCKIYQHNCGGQMFDEGRELEKHIVDPRVR